MEDAVRAAAFEEAAECALKIMREDGFSSRIPAAIRALSRQQATTHPKQERGS